MKVNRSPRQKLSEFLPPPPEKGNVCVFNLNGDYFSCAVGF